jgi:hypothetical protein
MTAGILPASRFTGPSAWRGDAMAEREWVVELSQEDVAELEAAAESLVRRGPAVAETLAHLTPATFPLPRLAPRLARVRDAVLHGRGFALLRRLPVERYSEVETATLFMGLGAHLGRARSQNARGHVLGHVRDVGLTSDDPNVRLYQTRQRQTFHTDSCDVVGLLCVPMPHDRRGEVPEGMRPFFDIPVLSDHDGHLTVFYQRQYIDSAQRFADARRLTEEDVLALDRFDALADDPALHLRMVLEPGDVQLVNNHALLHDRTAFEDGPDPATKRHLLRLWLACPGARPLPPAFAARYGALTVGDRGGIVVPGARLHVPLAPA